MVRVFDLGTPGPSGNENDTYVSDDIVYKVNNLLNSGSIIRLLEKVMMHNEIFPYTSYRLYAFTGFDGRSVMPVLCQDLVKNALPAPQIAIDTYMYPMLMVNYFFYSMKLKIQEKYLFTNLA